MKELNIKIRIGTSRGQDTAGYTTMTARDAASNVLLGSACGGGYDLFNSVLCEAIANRFQDQLRTALKGIDLNGDHPHYCFYRIKKGEITVDGAGGDSVTAKLMEVLGLELDKKICLIPHTHYYVIRSAKGKKAVK